MADRIFQDEEMNRDYESFMSATDVSVPARLSDTIRTKVHADLNPPPLHVFTKVGFLHLAVGSLTLAFCPQFGMEFTSLAQKFVHHLNGYHSFWCSLACGAVFLGTGTLFTFLFLRPEELRVVRRQRFLHFPVYALIAAVMLAAVGTINFVPTQLATWALGGFLAMTAISSIMLPLRVPSHRIRV